MPDTTPSAEEALRAANALLRQVIKAKDAELAAERAARERVELRLAELERRLGMDSTNSGTPTSKESIEAAARRKAAQRASQRERSKERKPGGRKGRHGTGLEPARPNSVHARAERTAHTPSALAAGTWRRVHQRR
ncbi:DUF6444 domain-containing protein [Nonomuraea sp. NPDC048916]|uniref:DUF6444 domain-containing protein n=1 Tax=Nonomuraea sp. NPDC048916 TaxID=3154232 RepID=UPI00340926CD